MQVPDPQESLFSLPPSELEAAEPDPEHTALAAKLPRGMRFGTMTWSFPGWLGIVYGPRAPKDRLASHGLTAYAKHPLLRAVEVDRSYYEPLPAAAFREWASQVPDDFRFVVKVHEECTVFRFPTHARYGKKRGELNPRFLDPGYAADAVVAPLVEGLGNKVGALLIQFPPQDVGSPEVFAERLHAFLHGLPKGVPYAVELRNEELLTRAYAEVLADAGAVHCHNAWTAMPSVLTQARQIPKEARRPLVVRWNLRRGDGFEEARARYAPFSRIVSEDLRNRDEIAYLVAKAAHHEVPSLVLVDNKAEGCSPESIVRLARAIAEKLR